MSPLHYRVDTHFHNFLVAVEAESTTGEATSEDVERGDTNKSERTFLYVWIGGGAGCLILIGVFTFFIVKRMKGRKKKNAGTAT